MSKYYHLWAKKKRKTLIINELRSEVCTSGGTRTRTGLLPQDFLTNYDFRHLLSKKEFVVWTFSSSCFDKIEI
jgi:hypothetical protein